MTTKRIVVGVDGSANSVHALERAMTLAAAIDADVDAVVTWQQYFGTVEVPVAPTISEEQLAAEASAHLDDALAAVDPGAVVVTRHVIEGDPATVLMEVAEGAEMLVLGSRGRGGFMGLLLGSVGQKCIYHAPCPVLVVPATAE